MVKRVKVGDCRYRTLDVEAGIRAYMGARGAKRFWHGYYSGKAVDHFTGGGVFEASGAQRASAAQALSPGRPVRSDETRVQSG
jgi:hypothetical protein